jgi:hypothetical protein
MAATFHCVCLAWCFFRLSVFSESLVCVQRWFTFDGDKMLAGGTADLALWLLLAVYGLIVLAVHHCGRAMPALASLDSPWHRTPFSRGFQWGLGVALLVLALLLAPGGEKPPFIYFQF